MTCDVTPHHLGFTDEWLAGARRWAWEAGDDPWSDGALVGPPYDTSLRVNPPLRARGDAAACLEALVDGTADAVVTDHAPHTEVDKALEFGLASNGISGLETALGILLAAVDCRPVAAAAGDRGTDDRPAGAARRPLAPDRRRPRRGRDGRPGRVRSLGVVGGHARVARVARQELAAARDPSCAGRVLLTIADGRLAYEAPED